MAGWYVRRGEKVVGPFPTDKLRELADGGKLLPTDQLARDAAGPWTEARQTKVFAKVEPPAPTSLTPSPAMPPAVLQEQPVPNKGAMVVQSVKVVFVTIGRSLQSITGVVGRSLSTRAQRRHEIKLAKIQAQALVDSQRQHTPPAPIQAQ